MEFRDQLVEQVPRLRRYARALMCNREHADDLVQDTLERALSKTEFFEKGTDLRAWLFTVMHNLYVNTIRKASMRAMHVGVEDEGVAERDEMAVTPNPAGSLELRDLDFALQQLPLDQREVVLLVGLEEMSYSDVALTLDIPIGTVMSRLSRGRERLRSLMSGKVPAARLKVVQ
jgi:RNA polymerase sigma-70 factor (ECF subfamily)